MTTGSTMAFVATRNAARKRLEDYAKKTGRHYAENRNFDLGPDTGHTTSVLSPYLRHRLVTEEETCRHVLADHALDHVEKFIQEVFWRSYFKGWLEMRPSVFDAYCQERDEALTAMQDDDDLRMRIEAAVNGRTGIEGFDDWACELVETGYLHNHARMWFASIWIFTLHLPWALGADFFYRHLADGDPASNTLSWRWVAGLQTRGKCYVATRANIEKFTNGRFSPSGLNENPQPVEGPPNPDPVPLPPAQQPKRSVPTFIVMSDDHCNFTPSNIQTDDLCAAAAISTIDARSPLPVGSVASRFHEGALDDAAHRFEADLAVPTTRSSVEALAGLIRRSGAEQVILPWPCVGSTRNALGPALSDLEADGVTIIRQREAWDERAWPHATKGYFPFRKNIPDLLERAGCNIEH
jgi:deoxyribodipyrimidine photo-lyase